jgi:hypothetical protein
MSNPLPVVRYRPAWVYWSLAFGFGPIVAAAVAWPWLSGLTTFLVAHLIEPPDSRIQVIPIRLAVHMGLPTVALYLVLRLCRLGHWLALSRLALALLLLANATMLSHVALLITEYAQGAISHLRLALEPATSAAAMVLLGLAATTISLTTAWYRWLASSPIRAFRWRSMLIEL